MFVNTNYQNSERIAHANRLKYKFIFLCLTHAL